MSRTVLISLISDSYCQYAGEADLVRTSTQEVQHVVLCIRNMCLELHSDAKIESGT